MRPSNRRQPMMRFSVGTGAMGMGKRMDEATTESSLVAGGPLRRFSAATIAQYDRLAHAFWDGTRDHDVSQNYTALLDAIEGDPPYAILDLGCGPGRDIHHFRSLGHDAVGLRTNSWPWHPPIPGPRFFTRIFSRWNSPRPPSTPPLRFPT